jgi:hypothetical protein
MTRRWQYASSLLLTTLATSFVVTGCGERKEVVAQQLIGRWQCVTQTVTYSDGKTEKQEVAWSLAFFADGSSLSVDQGATSWGKYTVTDPRHYTYQITQADKAEQIGLAGTNGMRVTPETLTLVIPARGKETNTVKDIETTCERQ